MGGTPRLAAKPSRCEQNLHPRRRGSFTSARPRCPSLKAAQSRAASRAPLRRMNIARSYAAKSLLLWLGVLCVPVVRFVAGCRDHRRPYVSSPLVSPSSVCEMYFPQADHRAAPCPPKYGLAPMSVDRKRSLVGVRRTPVAWSPAATDASNKDPLIFLPTGADGLRAVARLILRRTGFWSLSKRICTWARSHGHFY